MATSISKKFILGLIAIYGIGGQLKAQKLDSFLVTGSVRWTDDSIRYYPKKVKIESIYDPSFVRFIEVDSTGLYATYLPNGEYISSSYTNYHWQRNWDQSFVRINDLNSKKLIKVDSTSEDHNHILLLDTIGLKQEIPKTGVLFNPDYFDSEIIDSFIRENLDYYQVPGASIAIFKDGEIKYKQSYGVKNPITMEPVTENTLFEAGSITKPVFAFVVMRLVERGIIDLDKPLFEYLPFKDVAHDERYKLITARHVLSHQTGFPNWAERNEEGEFNLLFKPGTKFGYSGEGFEYLKRVVVHVLENDIETILQEELISPLNLNNFYFKTSEHVSQNATDGFYRGAPSKIRFVSEPMMAYSLTTNAKDFVDFALALRNKKGLNVDTYKEMFLNQISVNDRTYRGLGLEFGNDIAGAFYGHTGITRDFVSIYRFYPDLDIGFVFFANNITGGWLTINMMKQFLVTGKVD